MCEKTNYHGTSNTKIDKCIRPLINFLQGEDYDTIASCCGHGRYQVTVVIKERDSFKDTFVELFTQTTILRTRRFYVKDKEGYYFIPEVEEIQKWT